MSEYQDDAEAAPDAMTISQLSERTGVPPRRIRYYVTERLLPRPIGRGRAAHYTRRHLARLQQITALRDVNLSLDQIRARLGEASGDDVSREGPAPMAQAWRRWEIVPGVEVHAREDLDAETLSSLRVLIGAARHVLTDGSDDAVERTKAHE